LQQPFNYLMGDDLTQHSAYTSAAYRRKQKGHGIFGNQSVAGGKKIIDNEIKTEKGRAKHNPPDKAFGRGMFCKIASADKSGKTEEGDEHRVCYGVTPAGLHHEKG